jgi:ABC-type multidrug transport system fused ATPase/permease subunit
VGVIANALSSFRKLIDIFRDAPTAAPPNQVMAFYVYYLRQVWPSFLALLVVGLVGALIEVSLFSYLSRIIDLAQGTPNPNFFSDHALELTWMVVVALVLRPIFVALHDLLVHQTISPGMTSMINWQNHSYVLKQSVNFFQNDFAGRIAQRIVQTGNALRDSAVQTVDALWHVLIYSISALVLFAEADWRLMIPLLSWIAGFVVALWYFVPRVKERVLWCRPRHDPNSWAGSSMAIPTSRRSNCLPTPTPSSNTRERQSANRRSEDPTGRPRDHRDGYGDHHAQRHFDRLDHWSCACGSGVSRSSLSARSRWLPVL